MVIMKVLRVISVLFCVISSVCLWLVFLDIWVPSSKNIMLTAYTGNSIAWACLAASSILQSKQG